MTLRPFTAAADGANRVHVPAVGATLVVQTVSLQVDVTSSHHTSATIDYTSIGEAAKVLLPRRRQVRLLPDRSAGLITALGCHARPDRDIPRLPGTGSVKRAELTRFQDQVGPSP